MTIVWHPKALSVAFTMIITAQHCQKTEEFSVAIRVFYFMAFVPIQFLDLSILLDLIFIRGTYLAHCELVGHPR